MFCTNIRRRASFASVIPLLISTEGLKLKENRLETHDLAIPLPEFLNANGHNNHTTTHQLRVLLLSPTSTSTANLPYTLDRIHHFAGLTGGQDLIIVFLLSSPAGSKASAFGKTIPSTTKNNNNATTTNTSQPEESINTQPTLAFTHLQATLLPRTDIPHIPILPLSSLSSLPNLLLKHVSALSQKHQRNTTTTSTSNHRTPKPFDLLQLATTEPPMDRDTAFFATDCFTNLRELALACTEPGVDLRGLLLGLSGSESDFERLRFGKSGEEGRVATEKLRELRDLVGWEKFREIVDFWADEWIVE